MRRAGRRDLLADPQRRRVQQLERGGPVATSAGSAAVAAARSSKTSSPVAAYGAQRHGAEDRLGDEGQRALAAHDQVGRMSTGGVVVEQRVQPVAHGVLHRELLLDRRPPRPGRPGPGRAAGAGLRTARARQARSRVVGVGAPVSMTVPLGSTSDQRLQRRVGVRPGAAGHAAGVVGHHPADGAGRLAGRVGAELAPVRASRAFTWRTVAPGCTRTRAPSSSTSTSRKCRRTSTSTPSVTAWPLRLVPPERKVSGTPLRAGGPQQPADLGGRARGDHGLRGRAGSGRRRGPARAGPRARGHPARHGALERCGQRSARDPVSRSPARPSGPSPRPRPVC